MYTCTYSHMHARRMKLDFETSEVIHTVCVGVFVGFDDQYLSHECCYER